MSHELHTQAAKCGVALWVPGGLPAPTLLAANGFATICPWDIMLINFVFCFSPWILKQKRDHLQCTQPLNYKTVYDLILVIAYINTNSTLTTIVISY